MDSLFEPKVDYYPAVRLAINANVGPPVEIVGLWYDEWDEVFIIHVKETSGLVYEESLSGKLVFTCYKAVQKGITRWVE